MNTEEDWKEVIIRNTRNHTFLQSSQKHIRKVKLVKVAIYGDDFWFSEKHFVQVLIKAYGAAFNIHRIF